MAKKIIKSAEDIVKEMENENPENFSNDAEEEVETQEQKEEIPFNASGVYKENGKYKLADRRPKSENIDNIELGSDPTLVGSKIIPVDVLPSRGLFYEPGTKIGIRAASVAAVREWSTIDENDPISTQEKICSIIQKCVRVTSPSGTMTWTDISELDYFAILIRIHELTFPNGENNLEIPFKCESCGVETKVALNSSMTSEFFNPSDSIMRFYDQTKRCFVITSDKLTEPIQMYPPTIGVMNIVIKKAKEIRMSGGDPSEMKEAVIRCMQFFMPNYRNWTDEKYNKFDMNMSMWPMTKFQIVSWFVDEYTRCKSVNAKIQCEGCGEAISKPIFFRGGFGFKDLFCINFNGGAPI